MKSTITIDDVKLDVEYDYEDGVVVIEEVHINGECYLLLDRKVCDEIEQKLILINK